MPGEQLFAQKVPYSVEAEQAVIGSMLIDPNCIPKVIEAVVDSDFYIETNRLIFSTMSFMFTSGQIIDPITVMDEMKVMGYKNAANRDYFLQLIEMTPTSANVMEYCKIIRGKSLLRELQEISAEITQLTQDEQEDPQTIAELAEQKIYSVRQGREIKGLKTIKTAISEVYNHLDEMSKHPGKLPGLPTGFSDLDRMIGGLNNSDLILLASRPGMGKTSIALNIARAAIKDTNKAVVIFQLEMSSQQLAMRLLSGEALIDNKKLRMGNLDEDDWGRIAGAATSLTQNKILIDDNSGITVSEMKAKCRRLGNELGLVVVDYLQLMHSGRRIENRVQEVAEISRSLKIMAKDLNVPVLCLSQLSRGPESRQDKRPMLSDLRESGSIEQDADIVLFIYRPDYYPDAKPEAKNLAEVIIAKNRHGEVGKVELQWEGQFTTFRGRETRYDEPR
ncbi:MAG: replicative DNA helicase [Clostridia bacterium]|nr:replicative DNA helicase [Clostridia bacterium]